MEANKVIFFIRIPTSCFDSHLSLGQFDISARAYGEYVQVSPTTNSTKSPASGFPTSNKGCLPNIITNTVPTDQRDKVGVFFEYRSKSVNEQVYIAFFHNTVFLEPVCLPATTTVAIHMAELYQHTTLSGNGQRVGDYQTIDFLSRLDGVAFLQHFDAANGGNNPCKYPFISRPYHSATFSVSGPVLPSSTGFETAYICNKLNTVTGVCDDPNIFLNVRVHPNELTAAEKNKIDHVIDIRLRPYCMSKADLQVTVFRTDLTPCTDPPTQDFLNLV
ncbi:hypothetical protein RvY_16727 [Ramazzottius varieornatus]|uniref:Uncharacterized protein n=1 Tax=Ramazzottius varieornatus TaxID=947166 RepID=A0A1D1VZJ4_RAMVA|nr:hypothetical protein RvY_16727 [Ramazzottius varieornatus]